jgi:hypothetical protein
MLVLALTYKDIISDTFYRHKDIVLIRQVLWPSLRSASPLCCTRILMKLECLKMVYRKSSHTALKKEFKGRKLPGPSVMAEPFLFKGKKSLVII